MKYNDWIVLKEDRIIKNSKTYLLCQCKCGIIKEVYLTNLKNNKSKCCKSCSGKSVKLSAGFTKSWEGNAIGQLSGTMYSHIKSKARERNLEFSVSKQFLWDLLVKQNFKCALSSFPITLSTKINNTNNPDFKFITASLDRIDSTKEYTEDNVQWVHKDVNKMKMQYEQSYFISICKAIAENN